MKLNNPAPGRKVTSPYGMRKHPISGAWRKHRGTDYGGTFNVLAAQDGVVTKVSYNGSKTSGGGHVVIIKHGTKLFTVYYHGRERTKLNVGDRVRSGDFIYVSGSTGASTGPHLHWEVRTGAFGQWGTDVDPAPFLTGTAPLPSVPSGLAITGRLDRNTWRAWQEVLKKDWGYIGLIDGRPGKMTYTAIQKSIIEFGYPPRGVDGIMGINTRRGVQRRLAKKGFYKGAIDGIWGRGTISGLQRALNANKY